MPSPGSRFPYAVNTGMTAPTEALEIGQANVENAAIAEMVDLSRRLLFADFAAGVFLQFSGSEIGPMFTLQIDVEIPRPMAPAISV